MLLLTSHPPRSSARSSSLLSAKAATFVPQPGEHSLGWKGIAFGAGDGIIVTGDIDQEAAVSFDNRGSHVSFDRPAAADERALGDGAFEADEMLPVYKSDAEDEATYDGPGPDAHRVVPTLGDNQVLDLPHGHGLVEDGEGHDSEDEEQSLRLGFPRGAGVCPVTARSMHVDHLVAVLDLDAWIRKFEGREKVVGYRPQAWQHYSFLRVNLDAWPAACPSIFECPASAVIGATLLAI